jgi:hypothetical protein
VQYFKKYKQNHLKNDNYRFFYKVSSKFHEQVKFLPEIMDTEDKVEFLSNFSAKTAASLIGSTIHGNKNHIQNDPKK